MLSSLLESPRIDPSLGNIVATLPRAPARGHRPPGYPAGSPLRPPTSSRHRSAGALDSFRGRVSAVRSPKPAVYHVQLAIRTAATVRLQIGAPDLPPREAIVLLYQQTKTTVGDDVYVCIQCFRQQPGQEPVGAPYRQSSPYVLSRQLGSRRVIPGSVCESLKNLSRQLEQLTVSAGERVARIESAEADQRGEEYFEYDRHFTNSLVLISCLARNVFHTFPRLSEQYSVQMFDYGGKAMDEIRVKELLDLFVHNRYMNLQNEYIIDLVSAKLPDGTMIAEGFMGHKFKVQDFLSQVAEAIESVSIKDLATRLRGGVKSLNLDTPYQEIVFLVQNITSFSDLLEATIPSGSYDFMLNILFPASEIPASVQAAAKGREVRYEIRFRNPHVGVDNRVDEKHVKLSVKADVDYLVGGRVVHRESGEREKKLDYGDFFDQVVQAVGEQKLLDLVRRLERFRKPTNSGGGPAPILWTG